MRDREPAMAFATPLNARQGIMLQLRLGQADIAGTPYSQPCPKGPAREDQNVMSRHRCKIVNVRGGVNLVPVRVDVKQPLEKVR